MQLAREGLSFETTREVVGLGATHLLVQSKFDFNNPSFVVRGQLDNQFGQLFADSAMGELVDVGGKAALVGKALLAAEEAARGLRDGAYDALGIPNATERAADIDKKIKELEREIVLHEQKMAAQKADMDHKYKVWQSTKGPALARKADYEISKLAYAKLKLNYDEGPFSWKKQHARWTAWRATVQAFADAQAERQRVKAALGGTLDRIASHQGKTVVVTSASIETSLEKLMKLQIGMPVDITLELLFCGEPRTLTFPWILGNDLANAKTVVTLLIPSVVEIVNG